MSRAAQMPSYAVRPGVLFPDWSQVRSRTARTALDAILEVLGAEGRWGAGYEEALDLVWRAVLEARGRILGENHPDTLWTMSMLAFALVLLNDPQAEQLSRHEEEAR